MVLAFSLNVPELIQFLNLEGEHVGVNVNWFIGSSPEGLTTFDEDRLPYNRNAILCKKGSRLFVPVHALDRLHYFILVAPHDLNFVRLARLLNKFYAKPTALPGHGNKTNLRLTGDHTGFAGLVRFASNAYRVDFDS